MTIDATTMMTDAAQVSTPTEEGLAEVSDLASKQLELENQIQLAEDSLKRLVEIHTRISTQLLPAALRAYNLSEIKMADGSQVTIQKIVKASIPKPRESEAFLWLETAGHGDLIKHVVSANFGKGEEEAARIAIKALQESGVHANDKRSVHPQTLGAFVREQLDAGVALPHDILGVFIGEVAKIKPANG